MYIDTHFHFDNDNHDEFLNYIEKSRDVSVSPLIISGCNREMISDSLLLSGQVDDLYVSIGYHPDCASLITEKDFEYLEACLSHSCVVAIGEIGLDYHYGSGNKEVQRRVFVRQLEMAIKYSLPVVIHTRDAIQDTYDILKNFSGKFVLHCFSESLEMANLFLKLDCYFGIGGVITFKNNKLLKVVENIPIDRIVLETDSPYLAPVPYRGMINGSWNIPIIAEEVAKIKMITIENVAIETSKNARSLFDLE